MYDYVLSREADRRLSELPPLVQSRFLDHMDSLAADPVGLSRPSHFPYLPGFQLYKFAFEVDARRQSFVVLFKYAADEQTLLVHGFSHMERQ